MKIGSKKISQFLLSTIVIMSVNTALCVRGSFAERNYLNDAIDGFMQRQYGQNANWLIRTEYKGAQEYSLNAIDIYNYLEKGRYERAEENLELKGPKGGQEVAEIKEVVSNVSVQINGAGVLDEADYEIFVSFLDYVRQNPWSEWDQKHRNMFQSTKLLLYIVDDWQRNGGLEYYDSDFDLDEDGTYDHTYDWYRLRQASSIGEFNPYWQRMRNKLLSAFTKRMDKNRTSPLPWAWYEYLGAWDFDRTTRTEIMQMRSLSVDISYEGSIEPRSKEILGRSSPSFLNLQDEADLNVNNNGGSTRQVNNKAPEEMFTEETVYHIKEERMDGDQDEEPPSLQYTILEEQELEESTNDLQRKKKEEALEDTARETKELLETNELYLDDDVRNEAIHLIELVTSVSTLMEGVDLNTIARAMNDLTDSLKRVYDKYAKDTKEKYIKVATLLFINITDAELPDEYENSKLMTPERQVIALVDTAIKALKEKPLKECSQNEITALLEYEYVVSSQEECRMASNGIVGEFLTTVRKSFLDRSPVNTDYEDGKFKALFTLDKGSGAPTGK